MSRAVLCGDVAGLLAASPAEQAVGPPTTATAPAYALLGRADQQAAKAIAALYGREVVIDSLEGQTVEIVASRTAA